MWVRGPVYWFAVIATAVLAAWTPGPAGTVWAQLVPVPPQARPQAAEDQRADDADERGDDEASGGIAFPTDRRRERQLDQARRLINESRWSDVATLLDGILEADRDFFYQPTAGESTWRSVKSEAARLVAALPPAGREAYELQFRARAERALEQALAANDPAGVVAVARRWFQTPAGRRATLVAAVESLEAGQPLAAAAGLDRLALAADAAAFEPALSVLRAAALWRAGERTAATTVLDGARGRGAGVVRLGGREMPLSYPSGGATDWLAGVLGEPPVAAVRRAQEWWVSRGDSARNAIVESSRPLLVARYRVPLSRHPEESRLLERRRRQAAERETIASIWRAIMRSMYPSKGTEKAESPRRSSRQALKPSSKRALGSASPSSSTMLARNASSVSGRNGMSTVAVEPSGWRWGAPLTSMQTIGACAAKVMTAPTTSRDSSNPSGVR